MGCPREEYLIDSIYKESGVPVSVGVA